MSTSAMPDGTNYIALTIETLAERLGSVSAVAERVGADSGSWSVREVGDGNLNLVFIVAGSAGTVVVKQALPYVRLVGESWPLPLTRAFFEYHALTRQAARDPGRVPEIFHYDAEQALIVMEFLTPHTILRGKLIAGDKIEDLGGVLGRFCARTAFRSSDLHMPTAERKADAALFLANADLCAITEDLVFTDPYFEAELNHHTDGLDPVVAKLRGDVAMKAEAQHMLTKFASNAETLAHGDLHTGSVMCTATETMVIDPEFAVYAPMGFDIGMLIANFLMAYFSQPAHRDADELGGYQDWIMEVTAEVWSSFEVEFRHLWATERTGILYPKTMFEDQGHSSEGALNDKLAMILEDAIGVCGIEMHRRILSLAHNAEFETIEDTSVRAPLEARCLMMGRALILDRATITSLDTVLAMACSMNEEQVL